MISMLILTTINARIVAVPCEISGVGQWALTSPSRDELNTDDIPAAGAFAAFLLLNGLWILAFGVVLA